MFRINRSVDYAVRVMVSLAKRPAGSRLSTQTIQNEMRIPRAFLQRLIADLSRASLVQTFAGPNGGVELKGEPEQITLRTIWEAIEGPILISECLSAPGACPLDAGCPVHPHWGHLQHLLVRELDAVNLHQLAIEAAQLQAFSTENTPVISSVL